MRVRVRWSTAAKGAAVIVVALASLQALPPLLRPPEPPPLAPDVGLPRPRVSVNPESTPDSPSASGRLSPRGLQKASGVGAAVAVEGRRPQRKRAPEPVTVPAPAYERAPAAAPAPVEIAPEPPPEPPPEPASPGTPPAAAGDGSVEFSPH